VVRFARLEKATANARISRRAGLADLTTPQTGMAGPVGCSS
jgi:hypothetical protein